MLQLASPNISDDDIAAVVSVLRSGMLVQGAEVATLEQEFAAYVGVGHAIALTNGTATLHLALLALGVGAGDEVIVPSFSYIATANAVELTGATPVFVDITARSFNIDVSLIEQAITPRTKAIMPVHEFGLPCEITRIKEICDQYGLYLIEDAACALGSTVQGKFAGTFGQFGSYSLHPRKAVTSGEGGILVTDDEELAQKIRILRNHGVEMISGKMEFVAAGYNCRMTDFQAALVRGQLARLPQLLELRRQIAQRFLREITHPLLLLPEVPTHVEVNWQTFHLLVDPSIDRDSLITDLRSKGINTNYGAQCMPAQQFFSQKYPCDSSLAFPQGFHAWQHGLAIPAHEKLTENDIAHIINTLQSIH
jgi:dTDP-4-amino-4,6-dideoxygalactose transaminase